MNADAARESTTHAPDLSWTWGRLEALTGRDVYDLLALRSRIFVMEQACLFLDADGLDDRAWHLLGRADPGSEMRDGHASLVAYLRCVDPGVRYDEPSIGRVVVALEHRDAGLGRTLMEEGIARCRSLHPDAAIRISAQARLHAFYASLGFHAAGPVYPEDGIDHVEMLLPPIG